MKIARAFNRPETPTDAGHAAIVAIKGLTLATVLSASGCGSPSVVIDDTCTAPVILLNTSVVSVVVGDSARIVAQPNPTNLCVPHMPSVFDWRLDQVSLANLRVVDDSTVVLQGASAGHTLLRAAYRADPAVSRAISVNISSP